MDGSQGNTVTRRLERLERDMRYWKGVAAAALLGILGLLMMGYSSPPKIVEAQAFLVRSAEGQVRAGLAVLPDGLVSLTLYDSEGRSRAGLGTESDGSTGLRLADPSGKSRAVLGVSHQGWASLDLFDQGEQTVWSVWAAP